jgi:hypothetical protein
MTGEIMKKEHLDHNELLSFYISQKYKDKIVLVIYNLLDWVSNHNKDYINPYENEFITKFLKKIGIEFSDESSFYVSYSEIVMNDFFLIIYDDYDDADALFSSIPDDDPYAELWQNGECVSENT